MRGNTITYYRSHTQRKPNTKNQSIYNRGNGRKWKITNRVKTKKDERNFL